MLTLEDLISGYGRDAILRGVSFTVPDRSVVAVLGHNGAGKSSLVRALIGLIPVWEGRITLDGTDLTALPSPQRVQAGLAVSFQDDAVFPTLSVAANLKLGGHVHRHRPQWVAERIDYVLAMFPKLQRMLNQAAYTLSGGERRMLSIAMALMSDPKLLILDEPSTGLSPSMAEQVFDTVIQIRDRLGKSVLLIEQNVQQALAFADRAVVLKTGTVIFDGAPSTLADDSTELVRMF
jgi:ABC-type branched-subunit amino acid transport system ATPase component